MNNPEHIQRNELAAEHVPRPAPVKEAPDWRRFDVALARHGDHIAEGLTFATEHRTRIDEGTARHIAHVLGRSLGQDSALSYFARTGSGNYALLREEYLSLHNDSGVSGTTQELIDWLGDYLIRVHHPDAQTITAEESYPPRLDNILVPTTLAVSGISALVHIPGIYGTNDIEELKEELDNLSLAEDPGLQGFLALPDANAMSGDIMEDFHQRYVGTWRQKEDAITELCLLDDREEEVQDFAAERKLYFDYLTPDYEALQEEIEETFYLVEKGGRAYVFSK